MRKHKLLIVVAALAGSLMIAVGAVSGQAPETQTQDDVSVLSVAPVAFAFSDDGIDVAASDHGNLVRFESPTGYEHIAAGVFSEGYIACYTAPGTGARQAYDVGGAENGVFGAGVVGGSSITRRTDGPAGDGGKVQLRQSFAFGGPDRRLRITHRLTNLSNDTLTNVSFRRQVDFDIDTAGANGWAAFLNDFATDGNDRVTAWNTPGEAPAPSASHSMSLRAMESDAPHDARVTAAILDTSCDASTAVSPDITSDGVDFGATIRYHIGTLAPGKTANVTVMYDR